MPADFTLINGGVDVEISFVWTAPLDKGQSVINNSSELLYKRTSDPGDPDWNTLTNQEKLDLLYNYTRDFIMGLARQNVIETSVNTARDTANAGFGDDNELNE